MTTTKKPRRSLPNKRRQPHKVRRGNLARTQPMPALTMAEVVAESQHAATQALGAA